MRREPHEILFPVGAAVAASGVLPWLVFAVGAGGGVFRPAVRGAGYRAAFHPIAEAQAFVAAFALGLLFTALPRAGAAPAARLTVAAAAAGCVALAACGWAEAWLAAQAVWVALILLGAAFLLRRARVVSAALEGRAPWLAAAGLAALAGAAAAVAGAQAGPGRSALHDLGRALLWQGFPTALTLATAPLLLVRLRQAAAPRLRTPASVATEAPRGAATVAGSPADAAGARSLRPATLLHAAGALALLATFPILDGRGHRAAGFVARALLTAAVVLPAAVPLLRRTAGSAGALRPGPLPLPPRLAAVALLALPAGNVWAALDAGRPRAGLHLVYLGTFAALLLLASAAVEPRGAPAPRRFGPERLAWAWGLLAVALAARLALEYDAPSFHLWLGTGCGAFIATTLLWALPARRASAP